MRMPRIKLGLAYPLELVLTLAIGLAMASEYVRRVVESEESIKSMDSTESMEGVFPDDPQESTGDYQESVARADPAPPRITPGRFLDFGAIAAGFAGIMLAAGIGLWVEAARRRSPPSWGWGRWSLALTLAFMLCDAAIRLLDDIQTGMATFSWAYRLALYGEYTNSLFSEPLRLGPVVIATLATCWASRRAVDRAPDGREWTGRIIAFVALGITVAHFSRPVFHSCFGPIRQ